MAVGNEPAPVAGADVRTDDASGQAGRRNARLAYAGAFLSLTGVQLISPVLPQMRDALGLSDSQVSLVVGAYLLPGALGAIPAGLLADRIGRRRVFGWALLGFGTIGLVLPALGTSFELFLGLRFLQGLLFAGMLPLTMAIIGDSYSGNQLVAAHGRRSVAMTLGDGLLPIIGGVLAALTWWVPWLGQGSAALLGVVVLSRMTDPPTVHPGERRRFNFKMLGRLMRDRPILVLQYTGFLRMFLKYVLLTSLALLLVNEHDFGTAFAGTVLGVSALSATGVAASAGPIAKRVRATGAMAFAFVFMGLALVGFATVTHPFVILLLAVLYGTNDGLLSVFTNALITSVTSAEHRAAFVGITGAIRSFGKVLAPATIALLVTFVSLKTAFVACSALALAAPLAVFAMRPLDRLLEES